MDKTNERQPDQKSADWIAMKPFWQQATDIVDGRQAIVDAGDTYLPRMPNESDKDFEFRLQIAKFTNIYRDIIEGLSQKPFARELNLSDDSPERLVALTEDIDGLGNHIHVFAAETFFSGINMAIDWILVDYTKSDGLKTIADEKAAGVRPYWVHVPAISVIDIESEIIKGREQFTKFVIEECKGRVRTYIREGERVTWKVECQCDKGTWTVESEGVVTIGEIPVVPFITGRRKGIKWQFQPPMRDAADLQIGLYNQETAFEYIKTLTGYPMLAGNGVQPTLDAEGNAQAIPVGPQAVLYAPPNSEGAHGQWEWIKTDAANLRVLAEDIKSSKDELREIGRQPLTAQSGNMTVIATAFAASKGNSAVQAWALQLKDALEEAMLLTAKWLNVDGEFGIDVFTDFGIDEQSDKAPEQLIKMREIGDLSQETLWQEFKRRGILGPEFTAESETDNLFVELPGDDGLG